MGKLLRWLVLAILRSLCIFFVCSWMIIQSWWTFIITVVRNEDFFLNHNELLWSIMIDCIWAKCTYHCCRSLAWLASTILVYCRSILNVLLYEVSHRILWSLGVLTLPNVWALPLFNILKWCGHQTARWKTWCQVSRLHLHFTRSINFNIWRLLLVQHASLLLSWLKIIVNVAIFILDLLSKHSTLIDF